MIFEFRQQRHFIGFLFGLVGVALIALTLHPSRAQAYPEFIAYGYTSCLNCHYSGAGGGALNDYGRALFASEIAAKPPWFRNADDDALAQASGFFGTLAAPYWFKPGIKYRNLYYETNPGSNGQTLRYYNMQREINIASFTNEEAKFGAIVTAGYVDNAIQAYPNVAVNNGHLLMREYYLRWQPRNGLLFYLGFFDKPYGIRHPDHTAVNRVPLKLGQNDQAHGGMMEWHAGKHAIFVNPFLGNLNQAGKDQSAGASLLYEFEAQEKTIYGLGFKDESNKSETLVTAEGHTRVGLSAGHALLLEAGLKQDQLQGSPTTMGVYEYFEFDTKLTRGFHFQSILQMAKTDFKPEVPENYAWGLGFVYWPLQRFELRLQALQKRSRSDQTVKDDEWDAQGQLHISL